MNKDRITVDISFWSVIRVLLAIGFLGLVFYLREIAIQIFMALILASAIQPIIDKAKKRNIPKVLAILGVIVAILGLIVLMFELIVPPLSQQLGDFIAFLPSYLDEAAKKIFVSNPDFAQELSNQAINYIKNFRSIPTGFVSNIFSTAMNIFSFFVSTVLVLVMTFYMLMEKGGVGKSMLKYMPFKRQELASEILDKITSKLAIWLKSQLVLSLFVGFITFVVLTFLGIDLALALALFAAIMELVPVIGPLISAVPAVLIALTISPNKALWVIVAYLTIQQVENHILVPQIMKKALGLSPLVIIIGILIATKLIGFAGILLAVPVISALAVITEELYSKKTRKT
ncbi:hypothetical protein AUK11_03620 [bacterium CG2_30_37_16]|nr:MAG: hypothetical protein AUK11_03620 [bacterium CG2_30_37_16]PIP30492.1 MAG: hypothetical protein COX25_04480 [bacterium (Candidatus Howlettbacteria) CG23_combo_of_CG06-09_8_20_14_all_37_9]